MEQKEEDGGFMMDENSFEVRPEEAMSDDKPSPWMPCPQCGEIWLSVIGVLERGDWVPNPDGETATYQLDFEQPPKVAAYQSGPQMIGCTSCGHRFSLVDCGYPDSETVSG